jgi:hypothetical protein
MRFWLNKNYPFQPQGAEGVSIGLDKSKLTEKTRSEPMRLRL